MLAGEPEALAHALAQVQSPDATEVWAGTRAGDDPLADTAYGARWPYGGFVSMEHDPSDVEVLGDRIAAVMDVLGDAVDRVRSTVIVGTTHRIIDGRTDVALVYAIHRQVALTTLEYQDHWLNRHGPLAKELVPTSGYEQTHADVDAGHVLAARLGVSDEGFDGNATCFFPSRQHFAEMLAARERNSHMDAIYEDEVRFLDHSRSLGAMMRQVPGRGSTP
jgi:hypothetical protein